MSSENGSSTASILVKVLLIQGFMLALAGAAVAIFEIALLAPFVLGAMAFLVGNTYFTLMTFSFRLKPTSSEWDAKFALQQMSRGLRGKLMLSAILLALIFAFFDDMSPAAVLAGFIYSLVVHWFIASMIANEYSARANQTTNTVQDSNLND